ncbi:MAG: hypothetical protein HY235_07290, partial [Acidobacteria bacterium]|nr:hypothetical protein [Acidobacteriota bacterium]
MKTILLRNTRKTDRARGRNTPVFLKAMAPRGAAFALWRNTRKTDRARGRDTPVFLKAMAPRGAAFALLIVLPFLAHGQEWHYYGGDAG